MIRRNAPGVLHRIGTGMRHGRLLEALRYQSDTCIKFYCKSLGIPESLLHCGAHLGEEYFDYLRMGIHKVSWVEAQPSKIRDLEYKFGEKNVFAGVLAEFPDKEVDFFVTSNSLSSSSRKITVNEWNLEITETLRLMTISLDEVIRDYYLRNRELPELVILDLQGVEYEVLRGAEFVLRRKTALIIEYSNYNLYDGQKHLPDLRDFLKSHEMEMVYIDGNNRQGEALFVHKNRLSIRTRNRIRIRKLTNWVLLKSSRQISVLLAKLSYELIRLGKLSRSK